MSPIPIHVVENAPEMEIEVKGKGYKPAAFYIPELRLIEVYVDAIPEAAENLYKELSELGCNPKNKPIKEDVLVLTFVIHELRHFDQHQTLIKRYGEQDGTEMFKTLLTQGKYEERTFEQDAQLAQFGVFLDLNGVVDLAIAGKQLPMDEIQVQLTA